MRKLVGASLLLAACVESPDEATAEQAIVEANGVSLNGVSLNGVSLNGVSLNGISLNGVSLNGISLNGVSLNGISLNGVSLNGVSLNGTWLAGTRSDTGVPLTLPIAGVTLTGILSNGATLALHVEAAAALSGGDDSDHESDDDSDHNSDDTSSDVIAYTVSYASDGGSSPLCDGANQALAVAGTWNTQAGVPGGGSYTTSSDTFTFACRGKTIAKCIELGYKPWTGHSTEMQSCVRLLRGDYCGDGTPYTRDGHGVNLFDSKGVQADTALWLQEAEWTPDGATCISIDRQTRFAENGLTPHCVVDRALRATYGCGIPILAFENGATLISELPVDEAGGFFQLGTSRL